jgi:hypothetical protein
VFLPMSMPPWFSDRSRCYPGCVTDLRTMIEQQIALFSGDQLLIERAAAWRDASPEECLMATMESCREVEWMFAMMEAEVRERAMQPVPIPDHVLATLQALQR